MEAFSHAGVTSYCGDALDILPTLESGSVDCVVTSPPYAEQRKELYGGIPEAEYPQWTVAWMTALRHALKPQGSVLINIREHVKDGQISDYVHRTRLAVREAGWIECDELIWFKHNSPPVGHTGRPRRSWERVLWFSQSRQPYCNSRASGRVSGGSGSCLGAASWQQYRHGGQREIKVGVSRDPDIYGSVLGMTGGESHPAAYPIDFAAWMLALVCPDGGAVVDPFAGSGTTGKAAQLSQRRCILCELNPEYIAIQKRRLNVQQAVMAL